MNQIKQQNLDWFPIPADIQRGSKARAMALPAIQPRQYGSWKDFQQAWFWNLFWASAKHGGFLPAGPDLWQTAGALTRARWDANRAAVLDAFGCTQPDADGRFCIYYPPLLGILDTQKKKYRKKVESTLSETSTGLHMEDMGCSPSTILSFDFELDSKNQKQNLSSNELNERLVDEMEESRNLPEGSAVDRSAEIREGARRILAILRLPDTFTAEAVAAVGTMVKQTRISMDGIVQRITDAANRAERDDVCREEFLGHFLAQRCARRILEMLNLPIKDNFIDRMTAVVKAEAKDTGLPLEEVSDRIRQSASEARQNGLRVDIFYFEDMRWRANVRTNKAEQRKINNLEVNAKVKQRIRERLGTS